MLKGSILVTGATGCLGSNLVHSLLACGEHVVVFKRHGDSLGPLAGYRSSLEIRFGDVCDQASLRKALAGVSQVYHLAGIVVPLNRFERMMWQVNVVGTYNVLHAARENQVQRVVHVSSTAAIGYPPDGFVADENFPFADSVETNSYSLTKHHGEEIALGFNSNSLHVVVVNPSAVLAPGGSLRYGWAALVNAIWQGRVPVWPIGGSAFCGRRDLVDGLIRAMQCGRPGHRYILSSANISYLELIQEIASILAVSPPRFRCRKRFFDTVGRLNDLMAKIVKDPAKSPILVSENTALMSRMLFYCQSKAVHELGVSQTPIRESLLEMCDWCRKEAGHVVL